MLIKFRILKIQITITCRKDWSLEFVNWYFPNL
jgi:hypothetical protein